MGLLNPSCTNTLKNFYVLKAKKLVFDETGSRKDVGSRYSKVSTRHQHSRRDYNIGISMYTRNLIF